MNPTETLADIAVTRPLASKVFHRYGLDFCCGGRRPLAEAADARGLDAWTIIREIESEHAAATPAPAWRFAPLQDLIEHIVGHYHARLRADLPELVAMAAKVEAVHAEKASCPRGLRAHLEMIQDAVGDHLDKEEGILFPLILSGRGAYAASPIKVMELEHQEHGDNLAKTRQITNDLTPPEEACTTWRALYARLGTLEEELMEHIHLENNILFQRALTE